LDNTHKATLLSDINSISILEKTPFFKPKMPKTEKPFSVMMTNVGNTGWVSDKMGYRYQPNHPVTGENWCNIPPSFLKIWHALITDYTPDCALINLYKGDARMGLHRDSDESDLSAPVLSISLGASALFKYGGKKRTDPTTSFKLHDGDVVILQNQSRLIYHGIHKIFVNDKHQNRINITMRKAL
jgi:alkylated DNA repair protein (DNA oxidative demethylase)